MRVDSVEALGRVTGQISESSWSAKQLSSRAEHGLPVLLSTVVGSLNQPKTGARASTYSPHHS